MTLKPKVLKLNTRSHIIFSCSNYLKILKKHWDRIFYKCFKFKCWQRLTTIQKHYFVVKINTIWIQYSVCLVGPASSGAVSIPLLPV